ncbi:hypothetical protein ACIO3O_28665 [Streptomyces sp. NPDC087440]|uniref:hypothetical protein n=1 Tax=Streptomyces sp. NPDC087440 TaxID=3365790 RepID=UPI0037FB88E7
MPSRPSACAAAVLVAGLLVGCGTESVATPERPGGRACPTDELRPDPAATENTPEARALADALDPPKRGTGAHAAYDDTYSSMEVDRPRGRVTLCVSDLGRGRAWVAAVRKAHPDVDTGRVDLRLAGWSKKEVDAAGERVRKHAAQYEKEYGFPVSTLSLDGAKGLTVGTSREGAASREFRERLVREAGAVAVRVEVAHEVGGDLARRPDAPAATRAR